LFSMHVVPVDIGVVMRESLYIEFIALAFIKCSIQHNEVLAGNRPLKYFGSASGMFCLGEGFYKDVFVSFIAIDRSS